MGRPPRFQVSAAAVRVRSRWRASGLWTLGQDPKCKGRRARLRWAGLGHHGGLCVHNTSILSHS